MYKKRIELPAFKFDIFIESKVIPRNLVVELKGIHLLRDFDGETASIENPIYEYSIESTRGGIIVRFYILNNSEDEMERLDYLVDEEFEIRNLELFISNGKTTLENYEVQEDSFLQTTYKFEEQMSPLSETVAEFFGDYLVDENDEPDEESIDKILSLIATSERTDNKFAETLLNICTTFI